MKTLLPLLAALLLTPGCLISSGGGSSDDTDASDETGTADETGTTDTPDPTVGDESELLAECREGIDVGEAVQIVEDFDQSIHEMVACGGLTATLCGSIVSGIVQAIIDGASDATPPEWTYEGDGSYTSDAAGAGMVTRFYLGDDYSFGNAGDALTENLFEVATYLRGASVELVVDTDNPLNSSAELHFEGTGPYVELLGLGPDPQSPIAVDTGTWDFIETQLGTLEFESEIEVSDPQDQTTVRYQVHTPRMSAAALLGAVPMGYELDLADASRADLGQDLIVETWGIDFVNGNVGALEGVIDFRIAGGPLEYLGALVYENSTYGSAELECP